MLRASTVVRAVLAAILDFDVGVVRRLSDFRGDPVAISDWELGEFDF